MADRFEYSVFLSSHPDDLPTAEELAKAIRKESLRVCINGMDLRDQETAEEALERILRTSRTLVLLVSSSSLRTGWAALGRRTAMFRDPMDSRRRFVPVIVDECREELPETIRQYGFIDYSKRSGKAATDLAAACRSASKIAKKPSGKSHRIALGLFSLSNTADIADVGETKRGNAIYIAAGKEIDLYHLNGDKYDGRYISQYGRIKCIAPSPDGSRIAIGLENASVGILHLSSGSIQPLPVKHRGEVVTVEWSHDGRRLYTGAGDNTIGIWDFGSKKAVGSLSGHKAGIGQVAISPDGKRAVSASYDNHIRLWDLDTYKCLSTFGNHGFPINSVAYLPDGKHILSGSDECAVRLWDLESKTCVASMEGHRDAIWRVAYSPQNRIAASGGWDNTVRIWEVWSGKCLQVIKLNDVINFVRFDREGTRLFVGSGEKLYVYKFNKKLLDRVASLETDTRRYSNAKVVLVGEGGIGKSCLATRLVEDRWHPGESTHGMRVWPLRLPSSSDEGTQREVWLWDLAGQPDYRLTHQIFLDETSLALVLFDPASPDDPFQGIKHWEMALRQAVGREPVKILVASKTDVSSVTVTRGKIDRLVSDRAYAGFVATSSYTGKGRPDLIQLIADSIPWDRTPWIATPRLFKVLKDAIVTIKDLNLVTIQFAALRQQLQLSHPGERFDESDLRTVVRLLAGQGLIKTLKFGDVILLKPELMNNYAAAVVRAAREHAEGIGCIRERTVLSGDFDFQGMARSPKADEDILLRAVVETFVERSLCISQATSEGDVLVFPSHYNRELEIGDRPPELVVYRFAGNVTNIYTTLVVRLRYTQGFEEPELYKNAAVFRTNDGYQLGFAVNFDSEGSGKLKVFFDLGVADDTRVTFIRYIHEHLQKNGLNVERHRNYFCPMKSCGMPYTQIDALHRRIAKGYDFVVCADCLSEIPLLDLVEKKFKEDRFQLQVSELEQRASINLDNESKEMLLIGHTFTVAAEAGCLFRPTTNSDHGIDGEIEFKNDRGEASGQRVYLQLKSGDSYIYQRASDGNDIFTVKNERHLRYWQSQAYPVYLVHRDSDDRTLWMDVSEYLGRRQDKDSMQIIFSGERFNAFSLMRLANRMLS